jgi:hypothetical protein
MLGLLQSRDRWMLAHAWQAHGLDTLFATCVLGLMVASSASAHGGPPSAFGIVAASSSKPTLVVLNEGLAVERRGGWSFLCPSLWGDGNIGSGKAPLAQSVDAITSFIVGADDLYAVRDGVVSGQGRPELSAATVIGLAADGDALFGLRITSEGSELIRIDDADAPTLYRSAEHFSAFAASAGRLHLGRFSQTGELVITSLNRAAEVLAEERVQMGLTSAQLRLRPNAQRMFAVLIEEGHYTLGAIEDQRWQMIAQVNAPIEGPEASPSGQLWIALDGQLMRETADGFEGIGEARPVTCLGRSDSWAYACVGGDIYRLENEGLGERIFQLDRLAPPDPALVSPGAAEDCQIQWALFRGDLERVGLTPLDSPLPAAPPAGADAGAHDGKADQNDGSDASDCGVARARSAATWPAWLLAACAAARFRRRR